VRTNRYAWPLAGLVAGGAGLATSYFVAMALSIRESPVVAIAEAVIRLTPGALAEKAVQTLGHHDKPFLVAVVLVLTCLVFAWAGRLAARSSWASGAVLAVLAVLAGAAVATRHGTGLSDQVPVVVGFVTWLVALSVLTEPLRRAAARTAVDTGTGQTSYDGSQTRRAFVLRAGTMAALAVTLGVVGRVVGRGRRQVEQARSLLRLAGVTQPLVPAKARIGLDGVSPWMTPADGFYRIDTSIVAPAIQPSDWQLRIHGLVDREVVITFDELVARKFTEDWITLNCVSNPVGGDLIGNAWWSGVRLADLLAEAGVQAGADAVLQTSDDGWTCGTPLSALTDSRDAILAVAMNGKPLPIDHGFPVRTVVPGLYGYVSACKWVVDMEVTRFAKISAFWTERGWGEKGPVKMSSRIDVPRSGDQVAAGSGRVGGVAWAQHTGISAVEYALDGGDWQPAEISSPGTDDAWVQWAATVDLDQGDHTMRVRATDKTGLVQTGVERDVLPDGSTGWHTIGFSAKA
jgi:DMSO/TMAO reductase YedYZ molybdopterin-dependent catalytic subunit